ncbi:hypothetical protein [Acidiferrobacter thiooxydans]|jgi:3-deoxy-D-manno-octulosonic-acid transferase|uniref:3-deoxy-D-manno-octulosonic acid transferase n=1 Tax=Acidiferrobacter thiooxydans TaxID=163359 RepID=A0A1C2FY06_9GAMM|nr:hypothetical protein [Acidiferrobacter thiooxydans]MDA8191626.1 3-deoxy-D-manno-octulosonic acid transferase [Gammaproteobacteria bacterium]RCN56742.1 3-deoxy-D-manno-octulosonic acid transferase [Acidiferrobacter thiooxydans]UEN99419.1 hypothetical protein A9R16_013470 [Acidiferrobacter thiooxydans]
MGDTPLLRFAQWYWPGRPPLADSCWVVATAARACAAQELLAALQGAGHGPLALLLLDEGGYEGPLPWVRMPALGAARILSRLKPRILLCLDDDPRARAAAAAASCPVAWVNGRAPELLSLGAVAVASEAVALRIGGGVVTGDPLSAWPAAPEAPADTRFCERFQAVRKAGRWVVYFAGTEPGEEALAYTTFLALSAGSGGLLALAPRDPGRHEEVYREAIKYHLTTVRQLRLMTSEVPSKTRVYYIESAEARHAMHGCADLIVAGGTLVGGAPLPPEPPVAGAAILAGPYPRNPLLAAAVDAEVVVSCAGVADLARVAGTWLADAAGRGRMAQALGRWVTSQPGARARFLAWFAEVSRGAA